MKKIVTGIILAMAATSCIGNRQTAEENRELRDRLEITAAEIDSLRQANEELRLKIGQLESENYWYEAGETGAALIAAGIEDPEAYIADQLSEYPEVIPAEAILGGTMFFWNVQVLGREWLIADYSDGHIAGRAIYRYGLDDDGKLRFSVMASQMD